MGKTNFKSTQWQNFFFFFEMEDLGEVVMELQFTSNSSIAGYIESLLFHQ